MTTTGLTRTEHPNADRLRAGFDAFGRGDLDAVRATFTDDATWTSPGVNPLAGSHRGWDDISAMFGRLMEITGGTFHMDVLSVTADDHWATAVYDATSTVGGRTDTHRCVLIDEMTPEGRARATRVFAFDQAAFDRHVTG